MYIEKSQINKKRGKQHNRKMSRKRKIKKTEKKCT